MREFKDVNLSLSAKAAQVLISFRFGKSEISDYCIRNGWGGLHLSIWDYKGIDESRAMIEEFRAKSKIPPFITSDTESGFGLVELKEATEFTTQMGIGATGNPDYAYEVAKATALEGKYTGLSWTYGPVVDVNTNPMNPSTNIRSFGTDPETVNKFAIKMIEAYQANGLIATAKHFPGQGHSEMNSHFKTETLNRSVDEMEACELIPFYEAIKAGVDAIMTNHAIYPAYDKEIASFSYKLLTELLKEKMGFKGLLITDCLEMAPIKKEFSIEESVPKAILAGNDIILTENDFELSHFAIMNALRKDIITEGMLDARIGKILNYKKKYGLFEPLPDKSMRPDLGAHKALARKIASESVKLVKQTTPMPLNLKPDESLLLLIPEAKRKLDVGVHHRDSMIKQKFTERHPNTTTLVFPEEPDESSEKAILDKCATSSAVVVDVSFKLSSGQLGVLNFRQIDFLRKMQKVNDKLFVIAVNPFTSDQYPFAGNIIHSFSPNEYVLEVVAAKILGK
ncbi:MAG: hypothetical protein A2020_03410 [Lentisphaerae bacterium GWF2_45_14]|nr:MAG: hypothetical protein A2020_03410 [Lentisphaerae bacterium GWF2_45_14]